MCLEEQDSTTRVSLGAFRRATAYPLRSAGTPTPPTTSSIGRRRSLGHQPSPKQPAGPGTGKNFPINLLACVVRCCPHSLRAFTTFALASDALAKFRRSQLRFQPLILWILPVVAFLFCPFLEESIMYLGYLEYLPRVNQVPSALGR